MIKRIMMAVSMLLMLIFASSCVHEWPEIPEGRKVTLHIHHELPWDLFEWTRSKYSSGTRSENLNALAARYIIGIYPAGSGTEIPYRKWTVYRTDITRADFDLELEVPVGSWDLRIWTDNASSSTGLSPYYDASDFSAISYADPFVGSDEYKDAFAGVITVDVPQTNTEDWGETEYDMELRRPLTAFAFIATDLKDFVEQEITRTRGPLALEVPPANLPPISLSDYEVRIRYTGFLPAVYHHFTDRPIDSYTGVSFSAKASRLNDEEALLGHDFVFINGGESTVRAELNLYHMDGSHIATVASFDVPVKRNRCTIVRGEFLTSKATGSTGIDPGFDGDFNIKIE